MNVELQKMSIWFKANKLSLNLTKTKWTLFHSQKKKRLIANDLPLLYIDNFEIVRESVIKFLGIFIDENLTWSLTALELCTNSEILLVKGLWTNCIFHLFIATWTMQILLGLALTNQI